MTVCFATNATQPGSQNKVCRELLRHLVKLFETNNNNFPTGLEEFFHVQQGENSQIKK